MNVPTWQDRVAGDLKGYDENTAKLDEIAALRATLVSEARKTLELQRVYDERGLQISRLETALDRLRLAASPTPAATLPTYSCETGQIDEALANFLAEHTRLNQDGIDTHAMNLTLLLNYAALHPTPESDIAEWIENGFVTPAATPVPSLTFDREEFARRVDLQVAEIPDRNSPEDQPEMMLVSGPELRNIIASVFETMDEEGDAE